MSLTQAVSKYRSSWEGHTSTEGTNLVRVMDRLSVASLEEINSEFNALTQQGLWNDPLIDIFFDELLNRLNEETTFAISTTWKKVSDWVNNPHVNIQIGFDEKYYLIDGDGSLIKVADLDSKSFSLMNGSFTEDIAIRIIQLLVNHQVLATVSYDSDNIRITAIESQGDPEEKVKLQNEIPGGRSIKVKVHLIEDPDYNLMKRLYLSLKTINPVIIDQYQDVLINQLVDYRGAVDIHRNAGITFEGSLMLGGMKEEEDDEGEVPSFL